MYLNIFRDKRLNEIINMMDITDLKVISNPEGRITRIDLELMPKGEDEADGDNKKYPDTV